MKMMNILSKLETGKQFLHVAIFLPQLLHWKCILKKLRWSIWHSRQIRAHFKMKTGAGIDELRGVPSLQKFDAFKIEFEMV